MTKVNPNNRNETKSDIFPQNIFKSDTITFFYQKLLKYFNVFQNGNFCFMTKVNPNNENETKSEIFLWDILKSEIIFHWS